MKMMKYLAYLFLGLVATQFCLAQEAAAKPSLGLVSTTPLVYGEQLILHSKILGEEVSFNVYLPQSFREASEDHVYPLVFINDSHGEEFFLTVSGLVKHLGELDRMPESIVVSLNDGGHIPEIDTHGMWGSTSTIDAWGNPEKYRRHLQKEVFPYFEKNYRAADFRMMIGVSGSALFPLYALAEAPELFQATFLVASADMIGMGLDSESTFIDSIVNSIPKSPHRKTTLYLGTADSDVNKDEPYRNNLRELVNRLKPLENKKLDFKSEVFEDEDHYNALVKSLLSAFEMVFPREKWSARYRDLAALPGDALANIDSFYQELSREYGFQILPKANRWNSVNCLRFMTRHLQQKERVSEAISVAQRWVQYRPRSPQAFGKLAELYEVDGQKERAIKNQREAVRWAKESKDRGLPEYESRLKEMVSEQGTRAE